MAVVKEFADAHIAFEGVAGSADIHDTVGILRTVVGEGGDVAFEVDLTGMVVHAGIEHQGLPEHEVDAEEALQPVGLAHHEAQAEVVVRVVAYGRQSRQGGESGAHEANDALGQCGVVEFSPDSGIGKVAL